MSELKKLIDVKSIVTIIITCTWTILSVILTVSDAVNPQVWNDVQKVFLMVVCFFFGTQFEKNKHNGEERL